MASAINNEVDGLYFSASLSFTLLIFAYNIFSHPIFEFVICNRIYVMCHERTMNTLKINVQMRKYLFVWVSISSFRTIQAWQYIEKRFDCIAIGEWKEKSSFFGFSKSGISILKLINWIVRKLTHLNGVKFEIWQSDLWYQNKNFFK